MLKRRGRVITGERDMHELEKGELRFLQLLKFKWSSLMNVK